MTQYQLKVLKDLNENSRLTLNPDFKIIDVKNTFNGTGINFKGFEITILEKVDEEPWILKVFRNIFKVD